MDYPDRKLDPRGKGVRRGTSIKGNTARRNQADGATQVEWGVIYRRTLSVPPTQASTGLTLGDKQQNKLRDVQSELLDFELEDVNKTPNVEYIGYNIPYSLNKHKRWEMIDQDSYSKGAFLKEFNKNNNSENPDLIAYQKYYARFNSMIPKKLAEYQSAYFISTQEQRLQKKKEEEEPKKEKRKRKKKVSEKSTQSHDADLTHINDLWEIRVHKGDGKYPSFSQDQRRRCSCCNTFPPNRNEKKERSS